MQSLNADQHGSSRETFSNYLFVRPLYRLFEHDPFEKRLPLFRIML